MFTRANTSFAHTCKVDLDTQLNECTAPKKNQNEKEKWAKGKREELQNDKKAAKKRNKKMSYAYIMYLARTHSHTSHLTLCTWTAAQMFKLVLSTQNNTKWYNIIQYCLRKKSRLNERKKWFLFNRIRECTMFMYHRFVHTLKMYNTNSEI